MPAKMGRKVGDKSPPIEQNNDTKKKRRRKNEAYEQKEEKLESFNAGSIYKIHLINFLCHKNFEIQMGPNVNFIHGVNGSGKSAIIAAIQLCMGSRAAETRRARQIKDMIRTGTDHAVVTIHLCNTGIEAYLPEVFGEMIILQRRLYMHRTHEYKMMSKTGKLISRKREDLEKILNHFAIQVNNPCVLLTQDDARALIASSKPSDKYDFFVRATRLKEMKENLQGIQANIDRASRNMELEDKKHSRHHEKFRQAEAEYEACKHITEMDKKLMELRQKLYWATILEKEREIEGKREVLAYLDKRRAKLEERLDSSNVVDMDGIQKQMDKELQDINANIMEKKHQLETTRVDIQAAMKEERLISRTFNEGKKTIEKAARRIQRFKKDIAALRKTVEGDAEKQQRQKDIELTQSEIERLEGKLEERKQDLKQIEEGPDLQQDIRLAKGERGEAEREFRETQMTLQRLKSSQDNKLAAYGKYSAHIQKEIGKNKRKFKVLPLGPVGVYVKVRGDTPDNQQWLMAIEDTVNKIMEAYVVDNYQDLMVLKQIFHKIFGNQSRPNIFIQNKPDQMYGVRQAVQRPGFRRVYDMIQIENPWAHNLAVDQCGVDVIYTTTDIQAAYEFARTIRCQSVVLPDCTKVHKVGTNSVNRRYSNKKRVKYLSVDRAGHIRGLEQDLATLTSRVRQAKAKEKQLQSEYGRQEKEYRRRDELVARTERALLDAKHKLQDLTNAVEEDPSNLDDEIEEINQRIAAEEDTIKTAEKKRETQKDIITKAKDTLKGRKAHFQEIRGEIIEHQQEKTKIEHKYAEKIETLTKNQKSREKLESKLDKTLGEIKKVKEEVYEESSKVELEIQKAAEFAGERPRGRLVASRIKGQISSLSSKIELEKKHHGDFVEAERVYIQATEALRKIQMEQESSKSILKKQKTSSKIEKASGETFYTRL